MRKGSSPRLDFISIAEEELNIDQTNRLISVCHTKNTRTKSEGTYPEG
jgi:hypothetical protein